MRILIKVMYDGTAFSGWQIQPSLRTVEGELTNAVERIAQTRTPVVGSGRTDAGVHAIAQMAHFDLNRDFDIKKIPQALNFYLSNDVRVVEAKRVPDSFHARKSAKKKTYIYKMYLSEFDNPLLNTRELKLNKNGIDLEKMKSASQVFVGKHDFRAFMSSGSSVTTTVRQVYECKIVKRGNSVVLAVSANGFLYNMVRKIVASLIGVGTGKKSIEDIKNSLNNPDLTQKETAPAHALYLHSVKY